MVKLHIAESEQVDFDVGSAAVSAWCTNDHPASRMEQGLRIALEWSDREGIVTGPEEQHRFAMAYARMHAREASLQAEPAVLGSVDYARGLLVDVSLQREAGKALDLDPMDRAERYSWSDSAMYEIPYVRADNAPDMMLKIAERDLAAIRDGTFSELSSGQRQNVELMLLRGVSPREAEFDRELHHVNAILMRGGWAVTRAEFSDDKDVGELARNADVMDQERFGPHSRTGGLSRHELGGLVDRLGQSMLSSRLREGSRNLYDPRPGKNPFIPDESKEGLQYATLTAVKNGRVGNQLERSVRAAMAYQQEQGIVLDRPAVRRMESAVMRLVSRREDRALTEEKAVKVLLVDTAIQKTAAEKLSVSAQRSNASEALSPSEGMLEELVGRGSYPVFTKLPVEKLDTKAVAQGRFHDLSDERGIGSAVQTAMFRSGRVLEGDIAKDIDRLLKAHPVSKERTPGWIESRDEPAKGKGAEWGKGASVPGPLFKDRGRSR